MKRIIQLAGLLFIVVFLVGGCTVVDDIRVTNAYNFPILVLRHSVYTAQGETKEKDHVVSHTIAAGDALTIPWWAADMEPILMMS